MKFQKSCLFCKSELSGRSDKKFCDVQCKSAFQYQQSKEQPQRFYNMVENQLRLNRKLLKQYNKSGKTTIRAQKLISEGFDPNYFTHYWKNSSGNVYLFVFEYGFLKIYERNIPKYLLIQWQDYMTKGTVHNSNP